MSHRNQVIEYIARKSLICLILTFVVNLIMNLFKVTRFIGDRSDVKHYLELLDNIDTYSYFYNSHLLFILKLLSPHS